MASYLSGFTHLEISLEEIKTATNNFHDSKVIGVGGFGKVYEGELSFLEGKCMVAFKRLDSKSDQGLPEFFKEIRMLSQYKHKNLISLLGFCKEGAEMILVYEHASRGSLDRMLNDTTLTWSQRLKICLDAAKGLSFLHDPNGKQQRVLHCDVKSANVLLDESLNAKVADFGLSKISPANQQLSLLVTSPVGTPGYCDPLYMNTYQLTKESDVYSFGVVLFEVLCGRVCYEKSDGKLKIFVHFWKACYEQEKLDEIIFQDLMPQMNPSSLETFVDIAYQCLQNSHKQRPTMSLVVEKLKIANQYQEIVNFKPSEYEEMLNAADSPLIYRSNMELKEILIKGFHVNGGKTFFSINDKEENCERIYIEGCLNLDEIPKYDITRPSGNDSSRFPGGRCYEYHLRFKASVRAQFLSPEITYKLNLVFAYKKKIETYIPLWYKLDGEMKVFVVYDTDRGEDGWFVAPLYQFKSVHKAVHFELIFKSIDYNYRIQVAGIEFQPLEEKVDHYRVLEYQDIVQAASQPLLYKSPEELKVLLSKGVYLNEYKTWFSLNEKGQHCVEISIVDCLIPNETSCSHYNPTRFASYYDSGYKGFKVHIRTQFLSPLTRYTINLVVEKSYGNSKQRYVALTYKLEGETQTSTVYLANDRKDGPNALAELYQFTSDGRVVDLEMFICNAYDVEIEGILFQPLEKVNHEQVLEDENLSDDSLQWTMKEENLCSNIWKWFVDNGQEGYSVDKNGKKLLMLSARGVIRSEDMSFKSLPESRFGEVTCITSYEFDIVKRIISDVLSPETTYAIYLVYKLTEDHPVLYMSNRTSGQSDKEYIYLVIPPNTPTIGQKLDQNTHKPLNRLKLNAVPRQRSDGWMEVKLSKLQTPRSTDAIYMHLRLRNSGYESLSGLNIQSIELRPIVAHSV